MGDHAGIGILDLEQLAVISGQPQPTPQSIDATALRRELGLLSEDEVAALADVEIKTVRDWRTKRTGPPFTHLGRRPLYRVEAVMKWLREQEQETQKT